VHLHPVYHGSGCPELRLSAKIGQFLPTLKVHIPLWNRNRKHPSHLDGGRVFYRYNDSQGEPAALVTASIFDEAAKESVQ
jgi:hypothetical protein